MRNLTRATLAAIGILPFSLFANDSSLSSTDVINDSRLVIEWQQGKSVGGFIDGMMPFYGDNSHIWFADMQAYKYGDQYETVGLGIGHRGIVQNAIYGVYGFYDYQKSENKKTYGRVSIGLERLTETWDVLANFNYYVFKAKNDLVNEGIQTGGVEGNDVFYMYAFDTEKVYSGANIEVGRSLGTPHLRGYLGAYTYGGKINGASVRVNYQINQNISFTAGTRHDIVRGWLTTAGIQYWIGKSNSYSGDFNLADRLRDPIMRDMTVTNELDFSHTEKQYDSRKIYFASPNVVVGGANTGTAADPTSYADALSKAGADGFVYLTKGDGTAYTLGDVTIGKQTLWGAGADLYSRGIVLVSGASANQPSLTDTTINLTNAGTVGGFNLVGTGRDYGINISHSAGTATVQNVTLSGTFAQSAINVTSSADAMIKDSTIAATSARNGIEIANTAGTVTVDNTNISGAYTVAGIDVNGSSADANIINGTTASTTSTNDSALRIRNGANATIDSSTFKDSSFGIRVQSAGTATITNSTLTGNTLDGLSVDGANTTITLSGNNSITNNDRRGIFAFDNAVVKMTGGTVSVVAGEAAEVQSGGDITFTNLTTLTGIIRRDETGGSGPSQITVNGAAQFPDDTSDQSKTCSITSGSGTCN